MQVLLKAAPCQCSQPCLCPVCALRVWDPRSASLLDEPAKGEGQPRPSAQAGTPGPQGTRLGSSNQAGGSPGPGLLEVVATANQH